MSATPTTAITFQNFFSTTLSSDITSSATDIFLDTVPNGSEGFLVIEPESSNREVIYYNSKTALKVVCPSAADGRGQDDTSAVAHSQGSTVIMAPIAAYFETLLSLFTTSPQGWTALSGTFSVASGYNAGNKSYTIDTTTDQTSVLSPGMRFKITRGTTPPTQCTDLESTSSQYASKTTPSGVSFTDDFTCEAWVKLESYTQGAIISRYNGTNGFECYVTGSGQITLLGHSGASGNYRQVTTYQSIPLGRWVHIAACLDMSTYTTATSPIYIDGVSVPVALSQGGTNPTSLTQAGDLQLGASNSTLFFDGKLADVRLWSVVRTASQIRDNMNNQLTGAESNLVGYWKLDGGFTDATSNANNMTGQNAAVATNVDNPMNSTEYGIITKVTSTQVVVFTGTDYNIPNMTLSTPYYSTYKSPFGFPTSRGKWKVETVYCASETVSIGSTNTWYASTGGKLTVPIGGWIVGFQGGFQLHSTVSGTRDGSIALESSAPTNGAYIQARTAQMPYITSSADGLGNLFKQYPETLAADTTFTLYGSIQGSSGTEDWRIRGDRGTVIIFAENAYI